MMRRTSILFVGVLLIGGCGGDGVTIYAPPELARGAIFVDSKPAGHFQKTQREYRWVGWAKMKEELMNAPRSETIAKLSPVSAGTHELRIVKEGYDPIVTKFSYSSGRAEIEIDDALLKPLSTPAAATPCPPNEARR